MLAEFFNLDRLDIKPTKLQKNICAVLLSFFPTQKSAMLQARAIPKIADKWIMVTLSKPDHNTQY